MTRGQIALWMLTKFAMVFFIFALALIMAGFAKTEKAALCGIEADRVANAVSTLVQEVVNSPSEDERKIYPLSSSLSAGSGQFAAYEINISRRSIGGVDSLVVDVKARGDASCSAGRRIPLKTTFESDDVFFSRSGAADSTRESPVLHENMLLEPSLAQDRSSYLVVVRCKQKIGVVMGLGGALEIGEYLHLVDCASTGYDAPNPGTCLSFNDPGLKCQCGWECPP